MVVVKKEKVLFIMQLPPPIHGVSVMSELIKSSNIINHTFNCDYINLATASGIEDLQKMSLHKYWSILKIILHVLTKLVTNRYHKVYVTLFPFGFSFIKDAVVIKLCCLFGYTPLVHLHTLGFRKSTDSSVLRKFIYTRVFKNVQVICLSDSLIKDIEQLYKGSVYVLPNGIPQVNFKNPVKPFQGVVKILYLSNLIKGKGILIVMEAICMVKEAGHDFHLTVAGSEHDVTYDALKTLVKEKNLSNNVTLSGPKFNEEKYTEFKQADIFVLPSNYDTFGLVLLEAMQFGVPCISTNSGAIPELVGEGRGIILPEISAIELAKAIIYLIKHPDERKKMSNASFEYFESHYTVEHFENGMLAILNNQPLRENKRLVNTSL